MAVVTKVEKAVARAAVQRGYLSTHSLRQALVALHELQSSGRSVTLLQVLGARFLPVEHVPELKALFFELCQRTTLGGTPPSSSASSFHAEVSEDLLRFSLEASQRPPEEDPPEIRACVLAASQPEMAELDAALLQVTLADGRQPLMAPPEAAFPEAAFPEVALPEEAAPPKVSPPESRPQPPSPPPAEPTSESGSRKRKSSEFCYCMSCGTQLPRTAKFCLECGVRVGELPPAEDARKEPVGRARRWGGRVVLLAVLLTAGAVWGRPYLPAPLQRGLMVLEERLSAWRDYAASLLRGS